MAVQHVIAVDLGAGSGRVMDVQFDGTRLHLNELYRFTHDPVRVMDTVLECAGHVEAYPNWIEQTAQ